ncbi:sigma-70 family RNA polymerase sigma factor [Novipirellula caenicola]|uniref:Serine/threonine-protein kinase PknD n=1 Tax=Novipirellula caenicola TaxID=1536901 RepID=A0ABP9W2M9_9BACT
MGEAKKSKNVPVLTDQPDGWLLRQWKLGDECAAEVLFDRYSIRLVALVASRLNRRYRSTIAPEEIVQSALGSFFNAVKHSRIHASGNVSLWRLLATFARRKMARSIERQAAAKRGGDRDRISLDDVHVTPIDDNNESDDDEADRFLHTLRAELPEPLRVVVEGLLIGLTQRELADSLGIDERTVRRRLLRVRTMLAPERGTDADVQASTNTQPTLPRVSYHQFVLGKLIGAGGFGKVYRAAMQSDGSIVAVKFMRKAFWQNAPARQTFLREIDAASQIAHPGVIRYLGYGESPHGGPYVLSEWVDGQSLHDIANATIEQFTGWLIQVCGAIDAVHDAGLVHGDLSPSNILVDKHDRITITDFGFSQVFAADTPPILGGTLGFAAPEQIDPSFGRVSPKTDIYAIGGLVHWFLYRQPPNHGNQIGDIIAQTMANPKPDASRFADAPPPFQAILDATLLSSPSQRINRASALVMLLAPMRLGR